MEEHEPSSRHKRSAGSLASVLALQERSPRRPATARVAPRPGCQPSSGAAGLGPLLQDAPGGAVPDPGSPGPRWPCQTPWITLVTRNRKLLPHEPGILNEKSGREGETLHGTWSLCREPGPRTRRSALKSSRCKGSRPVRGRPAGLAGMPGNVPDSHPICRMPGQRGRHRQTGLARSGNPVPPVRRSAGAGQAADLSDPRSERTGPTDSMRTRSSRPLGRLCRRKRARQACPLPARPQQRAGSPGQGAGEGGGFSFEPGSPDRILKAARK